MRISSSKRDSVYIPNFTENKKIFNCRKKLRRVFIDHRKRNSCFACKTNENLWGTIGKALGKC